MRPFNELAPSTQKTYLKVMKKFIVDNLEILESDAPVSLLSDALNNTMNKMAARGNKVFYKARAALIRYIDTRIIREVDPAKKQDLEQLRFDFEFNLPSYAETRNTHTSLNHTSDVSEKRRQEIPENELKMLHAVAKPREKALIELAVAAGLRTAEVMLGASIEVTDPHTMLVHIRGVKMTETTGADRTIYVDLDELKALFGQLHITAYADSAELYRSERTLQAAIKRTAERANLSDITLYRFRHHFRTTLSRIADKATVAVAMGHQSIESQQVYGTRKKGGGGSVVRRVIGPAPRDPRKDARERKHSRNHVEFSEPTLS